MSNGITLDVIGVDTELLQDSILRGSLSGNRNNQLHWLIRTLAANSSNWRIVVGYQPLVVCVENEEQLKKKQVFDYLHRIFLKFSVNVYLSGRIALVMPLMVVLLILGIRASMLKNPIQFF
ncbi:Calcineurin metallo-phosphoesterase superfamily protein [Spatholobus suberectus]|nr:Calcineurin metallo-phosphoesterase superfamily protein [Spatholobus suberectus]